GMLGAWALDGCSDTEAAAIRAHLAECPDCAAQARRLRSAAGWLGMDRVQPAPAGLRRSVLAAARARRPPAAWVTLTNASAARVAPLGAALGGWPRADGRRADSRHGDVRGVLGHLAGNDALLAAELGLPAVPMPATGDGPAMRAAWRTQADAMLAGVAGADPGRAVRLAGAGQRPVRTLRDALVQRAVETWTHRDDIGATRPHAPADAAPPRAGAGRPPPPRRAAGARSGPRRPRVAPRPARLRRRRVDGAGRGGARRGHHRRRRRGLPPPGREPPPARDAAA